VLRACRHARRAGEELRRGMDVVDCREAAESIFLRQARSVHANRRWHVEAARDLARSLRGRLDLDGVRAPLRVAERVRRIGEEDVHEGDAAIFETWLERDVLRLAGVAVLPERGDGVVVRGHGDEAIVCDVRRLLQIIRTPDDFLRGTYVDDLG